MEFPTARSPQKFSMLTVTQKLCNLAITSVTCAKWVNGLSSVSRYKVATVRRSPLKLTVIGSYASKAQVSPGRKGKSTFSVQSLINSLHPAGCALVVRVTAQWPVMATQLIYKCESWSIIFYFPLQHLFLNTLSICTTFLPANIIFVEKSSFYVFPPHRGKKR